MTIAYRCSDGTATAPDMVRVHVRPLENDYEFHVNVKRYAIADLPDNDEELSAWLRQRYVEKDLFLTKLHSSWIQGLDEQVWEEPFWKRNNKDIRT